MGDFPLQFVKIEGEILTSQYAIYIININNIVRRRNAMNANQLLEYATQEVLELNSGECFLVRELFKGYLWNRIPRKDRLLLGTLFLNWIQQNPSIAKPINKTSSGQQRYQKN